MSPPPARVRHEHAEAAPRAGLEDRRHPAIVPVAHQGAPGDRRPPATHPGRVSRHRPRHPLG